MLIILALFSLSIYCLKKRFENIVKGDGIYVWDENVQTGYRFTSVEQVDEKNHKWVKDKDGTVWYFTDLLRNTFILEEDF